jgi:hypothetical protein
MAEASKASHLDAGSMPEQPRTPLGEQLLQIRRQMITSGDRHIGRLMQPIVHRRVDPQLGGRRADNAFWCDRGNTIVGTKHRPRRAAFLKREPPRRW